ncbi:hybrid sensor histidine kinase/response regulator [Alkalitalea saponilacus]|uniref:histidine kinase n=1 Tax=Alkalitalea saponilacus TaxID=889453 RepID=A0A1T5F9J8_9BACT|nr:hybrid sensor histidine kinase/response regulator [Alkalitalea saponilacus]ASB50108.1 hypothetical protein CDL62_13655 [Alkalitalea saponilacus]SKB92845.1 Signal transduction histidine kinase [Alkalitalea saponilacus]
MSLLNIRQIETEDKTIKMGKSKCLHLLPFKHMPKALCIIALFCTFQLTQPISFTNSTEIKLAHFSATNKLPGQSIQCIHQDSLGIIWLGIESVGLTKYDGKRTTIYNNVPGNTSSLSSNYPERIISDEFDQIWVATSNGLNRLNRKTGKVKRFYSKPENKKTISHNTLYDLKRDSFGNIWIATQNGVSILKPDKLEFVRFLHNPDYENPASHNEISSIHIDRDNNIWIASILRGLTKISAKSVAYLNEIWNFQSTTDVSANINQILNPSQYLRHTTIPPVRAMNSHHPDTIWLATQSGLYRYFQKTNTIKKFSFEDEKLSYLNNATYLSLNFDSNNLLWIGSANDGLIVLNLSNYRYQHLDASNYVKNELKSNSIREIMESSCGLIWICTKFGGLHYYDIRQQTFPVLRKSTDYANGLNDEFVLSVLSDKDDLWIGTKSGGLNRYHKKSNSFTYYTADGIEGSLGSNRIEDIVKDNTGTLWIGTEAGLYSKHSTNNQFIFRYPTHIRSLAFIKDALWLGTSNGIFRYSITEEKPSPLPTKHHSFFDTQSNIYIIEIYEDSSDNIWIATQATGLFQYIPESDQLIHHTHQPNNPNSISGDQVRAVYEDSKNRIWVGTKSDGLNLFDRELNSFTTISTPETLPSNTIYHILEDDSGVLWMGTHSGISSFDPTSGKFMNYPPVYGAQSYVFETNAFSKTGDGILLMGGNNGLNAFNPKQIHLKLHESPIVISNLRIFNESIATDISASKEFVLSHKSNYISFEFAMLDYTDPDENRYMYILEPFDENWIYSDTRNFANYTNLEPGKYTFKVKGMRSDGMINSKTLELSMVIPAPFWKTKWFTPILGLILVSIIVLAYYLKILSGKKREATLKAEVRQRTNDLSEAYNKLEQSNLQIEKHNRALRQQRDRISRQNLELKIHRQNLELMVADRTKDLEEEKLKAQESDQLKSAFLANMSHEIRTPLNAIMGFIDLLQAGEIKEEEQAYINNIIQSNSNTLLQLINDIIDLSIIEANQMIIYKSSVNFNQLLQEIKAHYSVNADLQLKNIQLLLETPNTENSIIINTDQGRVKQIYYNLINNAVKFTEKGFISFGYSVTQNKMVCFVKDTGIGIEEENMDKLFKRFHKIEPNDTKVHRGTGLGLSICKNLCKLLGGDIWLESVPGEGTTFYFSIQTK